MLTASVSSFDIFFAILVELVDFWYHDGIRIIDQIDRATHTPSRLASLCPAKALTH